MHTSARMCAGAHTHMHTHTLVCIKGDFLGVGSHDYGGLRIPTVCTQRRRRKASDIPWSEWESSDGRREEMRWRGPRSSRRQEKRDKFLLSPAFCPIRALNGLDAAHSHWGGSTFRRHPQKECRIWTARGGSSGHITITPANNSVGSTKGSRMIPKFSSYELEEQGLVRRWEGWER